MMMVVATVTAMLIEMADMTIADLVIAMLIITIFMRTVIRVCVCVCV